MKTTIELDEKKLVRLMGLGGFKTKREAIDFALTEAERPARIRKMLSRRRSLEELSNAVDPDYDLMKLRAMEMPSHVDTR